MTLGALGGEIVHHIPKSPEHLHRLWLRGGFPRAFLAPGDAAAAEWCREFVSTFLALDEWDGAEQALRMAKMPVFMYAGTEDAPHAGCAAAVALNPKARFLSLPGKNHATAAESVDLVLPSLLEHIGGVKAVYNRYRYLEEKRAALAVWSKELNG